MLAQTACSIENKRFSTEDHFIIYRNRGFSLLEVCIVIFILGSILALGLPQLDRFLMHEERELVLDRIKTAIDYAKQEAFARGATIVLCSTSNQITCTSQTNWSSGFMILEKNKEESSPLQAKILQVFQGTKYGRIHFNAFGSHDLIIQSDGSTNNGTFSYCPKNRDASEGAALVINKAGRVYRPIKKNERGIIILNLETTEETSLFCR